MDIYELIKKRRTIRKFKQIPIKRAMLEKFIDAAHYAPSGNNLQPLKYKIVDDHETVEKVFEYVKWAGSIYPAGNPGENEHPVAFIAILVDTRITTVIYELDVGSASENIFLTALEEGIGTCWMGAIDRKKIIEILEIPEYFLLNTVIALGYPAEAPIMEPSTGSVKYYKDENGVLHVPKRSLSEIII